MKLSRFLLRFLKQVALLGLLFLLVLPVNATLSCFRALVGDALHEIPLPLFNTELGSYGQQHSEVLEKIDELLALYTRETQTLLYQTDSGEALKKNVTVQQIHQAGVNLRVHVAAELRKLLPQLSDPILRNKLEVAIREIEVKKRPHSLDDESLWGDVTTVQKNRNNFFGGAFSQVSGHLTELRFFMSLNNLKAVNMKMGDFFKELAPDLDSPQKVTDTRESNTEIDAVTKNGSAWVWSEVKGIRFDDPGLNESTAKFYDQAQRRVQAIRDKGLSGKIKINYYFPNGICRAARARFMRLTGDGVNVFGPEIESKPKTL